MDCARLLEKLVGQGVMKGQDALSCLQGGFRAQNGPLHGSVDPNSGI